MTPATQEMDGILAKLEAAGVTKWDRFTIAKVAKCSIHHACYMIWDHQRSQRNVRPQNRPQMRFHRMAGYRTRAAAYQTGQERVDCADLVHSVASDIDCRVRSTYKDLDAVLQSNPTVAAAWASELNFVQTLLAHAVSNLLTVR